MLGSMHTTGKCFIPINRRSAYKDAAVPPPADIDDASYAVYPSQLPSEVDAPPYDLIDRSTPYPAPIIKATSHIPGS
ncbi:uncharacterized protein ARMOST_20845 [Armillaria ostoyae]|uniref:Uncharacterized protein n=1 Tax=Armillaria ostoyae TaxID=47428 RepID=A0A284S8J8_ARMOS|nr:uncharacterized protein ARMOST_20845 [Armillaria ostoyae]